MKNHFIDYAVGGKGKTFFTSFRIDGIGKRGRNGKDGWDRISPTNGMTPLIGTLGNAPYSDNNVRTFCNTSATVLRGKLHINSAPLARQSKFLT